jgi:hypothetical protein
LAAAGERLVHLDRATPLDEVRNKVVTANAYLGGWGIEEALARGADVVVTGRVSDASLVVGPAAWKLGWRRDDWDRIAAAVVAGHVLECGTQATGGNYAFFEEVPSFHRIGFPIAEMHADGSFVITKHPGTGGLVSVGTVTAQLLYEIDGPRYLNPDAVARFDSVKLQQEAPDRVRVSGVRGEPPPEKSKVSINYVAGYRNTATFLLCGLRVEEKAAIVERNLWELLGGKEGYALADARLMRTDRLAPVSNDEALARLQVTVVHEEAERVGKAFTSRAVELVTSSVPGLTLSGPPQDPSLCVLHWPALVGREHVRERVHIGGESVEVPPPPAGARAPWTPPSAVSTSPVGPVRRIPLGRVFGARSGDKGGNANVGVWARSEAGYAWLRDVLTVERVRQLLPDTAAYEVSRHQLPNLWAVNFVLKGYLGEGPALPRRSDPQAKSLGEYLRAQPIDVPVALMG